MVIRIHLLLLVSLFSLAGCSTLGYYAQSINGHLDLMSRGRPINEVVTDPTTDAGLRKRLLRVEEIRRFASDELKLPENDSYLSYADLQRKAVVWSVVATPEFSMEPKTWCYPVIGCASYRGYFSREDADFFAVELRDRGLDVTVEAVPAYSTLGWFDDPLPSTVSDWPEANVAGLIFHELAHQQLYIKGNSAFNEGFANTVEQVGVARWLTLEGDSEQLHKWQEARERQQEFVVLLLESRRRLLALYNSGGGEEALRVLKALEFQQLGKNYQQLKQQWGGFSGYDRWFSRPINNARLASVATYEHWVPGFMQILQREKGDMERFYRACGRIGERPVVELQEEMNRQSAEHY